VNGHDPARALDVPVVAAHWLTRAQLLEPARQLRTPLVIRCIDDYLSGRRLPLAAVAGAQAPAPVASAARR